LHGPRVVYDAFIRGVYPEVSIFEAQRAFRGRRIRCGTYGDPAAVPFFVWAAILLFADKVTGYTHQWRTCDRQFANYLMASVDSLAEREQAEALGYRPFAVLPRGAPRPPGLVLCPASHEAGKKTTCFACAACGGHDSKARAGIYIPAHGGGATHFDKRAA
jgi:hypothetical protein